MICYNCGNEVTTEGSNCPFCGSPLSAVDNQQQGFNSTVNQQAYDPNANQQAYDPNVNQQQAYDPNANQQQAYGQGYNQQQSYNPNMNQQGYNQGYNQQQAYNPNMNQQGYNQGYNQQGAPGQNGQGYWSTEMNSQNSSMDAKTASIVCYITWIGFLIAVICGDKNHPLFKFHLNNALLIYIGGVISGVFAVIPVIGWLAAIAASIFFFVCFILGIISAAQGEMKPLPLIGNIRLVN